MEQFSDILKLPKYEKNISYMAYPLIIRNPKRIPRLRLRTELERLGVETRPLFGSIPHHQPAYSHLRDMYRKKLPNAEFLGMNGFYIGCHQYLTEEDLGYINNSFKAAIKKVSGDSK